MPQKIKVLECIRQGQIGGGESHLLSLVQNLNKSLFDPIVLAFTDGPMIDTLKRMNVSTHIIHTTKPFDVTKWKAVKELIKDQKIDLIHAHGTRANSNVLWAAKKLRLPVIYTIHGWSFHPDQNPILKRIRIMSEHYLTSKSDFNISVSSSNQQTGKRYIRSFNSAIINNGINLEKFNPGNPHKNIRSELGIRENVTLVLFIARFTLHKQPLSLIKAFAEAISINPDIHMLMVGDGDQKQEATELIDELKLKDKITLESFRQDVPDVLASSDIFVLPSLWEGLPIGLLEAMAMGKAVIASNVDGTSEIIKHNENGWLVEIDNLAANLSKAIVTLSLNTDKRAKFEQNARNTVTERFDALNMTKEIEKLYTELLHRNNGNGVS